MPVVRDSMAFLLRLARENSRLKPDELARELAVDRLTIARWELGDAIPSQEELDRLTALAFRDFSGRGAAVPPASGGQVRPARAPFVGRVSELQSLAGVLATAARGEGGTVLVLGEAGIGKSRLLRELASMALNANSLVVTGRCLEVDGGAPFAPFVEVFDVLAAALTGEEMEAMQEAGASPFTVGSGDLWLPAGAADGLAGAELAAGRHAFLARARRLLQTVTSRQPVTVIIEDIHWADASSLMLLQHLAHWSATMAVVLVASCRDEALEGSPALSGVIHALRHEPANLELKLRRLSEDQVGEIIRAGHPEAPPLAVVRQVLAVTEGNPLFVEEVVRSLFEAGRLLAPDGGWRPAVALAEGEVPGSIAHFIELRARDLSAETRAVLTSAAILGRVFDFDVLRQMATDLADGVLLDAIEEAVRAGFVEEDTGPNAAAGSIRYRFSHDMFRQAMLASVSAPRRRLLHRSAAMALERIGPGPGLPAQAGAIANHFWLGRAEQDRGKVVAYASAAGDFALRAFAFDEAAQFRELAVAAARALPPDDVDLAALLEDAADVMIAANIHYVAGIAYLREAIQLYDERSDAFRAGRAHLRLGSALSTMAGYQDLPRALPHLRKAWAVAAEYGGTFASACAMSLCSAAALMWDRPALQEAVKWLREEARRDPAGPAGPVAEAATGYARLFFEARPDEALAALTSAASALEGSHDTASARWAWLLEYWLFQCHEGLLRDPVSVLDRLNADAAGDPGRWLPGARRSLGVLAFEAVVRSGDLAHPVEAEGEKLMAVARAYSYAWTGEWERAEGFWAWFADWAGSAGARPVQFSALHSLWEVRLLRKDYVAAETALRSALALCEETGALGPEVLVRTELAHCYAATGSTAEARRELERAAAHVGDPEWRGAGGRLLLAEAITTAAEGDIESAMAGFARAVGAFQRWSLPWDEALALQRWGEACRAAGRRYRSRAVEKFDAAIAVLRAHGAGERVIALVAEDRARAIGQNEELPGPDGLTPREVEVLQLLARGRSTRDIAEELVLSVRTVGRHITNIYAKIDARGRADAAAYALRHNLL